MRAPDSTLHAAVEIDERGVATLTIQAAGGLNILGTPVIDELRQAIEALGRLAELRVLVMRGTGDRAFVGGADIEEMAGLDRTSAERFIGGLRELCDSLRQLPVPVIARLPGWCLGGGLEVALACDLRIAADTAHFGMPEVKVGIPSVIHAALLPRLIGGARAAWLLLTGENCDSEQALSWGLIHERLPLEELDARIDRLAALLAQMGPSAIRQQKRMLREWEDQPLERSIECSVGEFGAAFDTGEPQRYMGEFLARKRSRSGRS